LEPTNGVITARRPEKDSSWLAGRALASRGSTQSLDLIFCICKDLEKFLTFPDFFQIYNSRLLNWAKLSKSVINIFQK
jgi:hypothetical protein